jgi:hypothetical protein
MANPEDTWFNILLSLLMSPLLMIYHGWIVSVFWSWFVAATFHIPALSVCQAIGVTLVVHMLVPYRSSNDKAVVTALCGGVVAATFVLLIGTIVHAFM